MKKIRWLWFPLVIGLLLTLPWILFHLRPGRPMSIVVLDKTVPFDTYLEHEGFFWLLDQYKIVQPSGERYDRTADYVGATPGERAGDPPAATRDLTREAAVGADLLYIIDTYGVYEEDLASGEEKKAALERSRKLYGGLTVAEAEAIRAARDGGTTVVAEFNSMASPTGREAAAILEEVVGVRWTRWIGRYFPLLEDREEVPQWLRDVCQRELAEPWTYEGPGYVLVQDDTRCEVLLGGSDSPTNRPDDRTRARGAERCLARGDAGDAVHVLVRSGDPRSSNGGAGLVPLGPQPAGERQTAPSRLTGEVSRDHEKPQRRRHAGLLLCRRFRGQHGGRRSGASGRFRFVPPLHRKGEADPQPSGLLLSLLRAADDPDPGFRRRVPLS